MYNIKMIRGIISRNSGKLKYMPTILLNTFITLFGLDRGNGVAERGKGERYGAFRDGGPYPELVEKTS